ncbi:DUF5677 domain-containing protein [Desulfomonile tiedjei]|uniref:Uncharacterized protein n=1 Tax=Desulfomonile tiedjei (strain ATCC 49306 / DSM 6799 / DCB-1) TaxID=706587 RepID=I4C5N1_DESTA|nr:DUF5677 domain-containing protein [Desulfomonile tiedjei]AFM24872.1 hypothetical protein Desti_2176 [Desulfomonile tiedjei DSM 6799]
MGFDKEEKYDWNWFRSSINQTARTIEPQIKQLLDFVSEVDLIVQQVVDRPTSYASERPQDYVVSILVVRSFRLFVSSMILSLSGYADVVPNLKRSVMEIGLMLLNMSSNPVAVALGYMLHSVQEEIISMETELGRLNTKGGNALNLPRNLEEWKNFHSLLGDLAKDRGLIAEEIQRNFARTSVRSLCREHASEEYYLVNYKADSLFTHGLHACLGGLVEDNPDQRTFMLGPAINHADAAVMDSIAQMTANLALAGDILEDEGVAQNAMSLCRRVENLITKSWSRMPE